MWAYKESVLVVLGALAAVAAVDAGAQRVAPVPPQIMEVDDGVRAYASGDPDTLVLGSSHTRSFAPMRDMVLARTHGANRMALVPVEWGTFASYRWVFEHRVRPLLEERTGGGAVRRRRLSRAILVTTFYDLCKRPGLSETNLPARAWTFEHFASDVAARGLDDFNGNFLATRVGDALPFFDLLQDRGHGRIVAGGIDAARGVTDEARAERRRHDLDVARGRMEEQYDYCDDPGHKRDLAALVDDFLARGLEVTVVLFPLLPDIVSPRSRETTLRRYDDYVADFARRRPVRVTDMTLRAPVAYGDFQPDLDHLTPAANARFSRWALDHAMPWLLEAPVRPPARPAP
jgi:hypothetical protein